MFFLGIDPGLTGAVACIDERSKLVWLHDTPVVTVGTRVEYDLQAMVALFAPWHTTSDMFPPVFVVIERQQAMPRQGVVSTFRTGYGFGLWMMLLHALKLPHGVPVLARAWKLDAGLAGIKVNWKEAARFTAQGLFPHAPLHLKKHHGRAEALLLANYGRRQHPALVESA